MADNLQSGVAKARLPIPGAVWDDLLVYEQRGVENARQQRKSGAARANREVHPIDAALAEGPTALVVMFSRPPPGLQATAAEQAEFYDCAVLAVAKTNVPSEIKIQLVTGHGMKRLEDFKHFASTRALQPCARGTALIGFVRFTAGLYVLMVTSREKVAVVGPHVVFDIRSSHLYYLGEVPKGGSLPSDEVRYETLFRQFDLSTGYLYSHTLDLTRRLATSLTVVGLPQRDKYRWNTYLAEPLEEIPAAMHLPVCMIRGSVMQSVVYFGLRQVSVMLVARCSKKFAGARYLKRGVNDDGHVANHVEVEQIVIDEDSLSPDRRTGNFSSFVQVRGSVPVFWGHENTLKPKPPMKFDRVDNSYTATKKHFNELFSDFGAPVYILNLLKRRERKIREQPLSERYRGALDALRFGIPNPDQIFRYVEFDFRNETHQAWNELTAIAEDVLRVTGAFVCTSESVVAMQTGVLRSNCVDCVDRTNYGQFFIGLHAFSIQLAALGIIPDASAVAHMSGLREQLLTLYMGLGDNIGRQYGGSNTVSAGLFGRGVGWDKLMGIKRFYINQFEDAERQRATNLFLGLYAPRAPVRPRYDDAHQYVIPLKCWTANTPTGLSAIARRVTNLFKKEDETREDSDRRVDLWDLESDYYLHVRHNTLPPVPAYDPSTALSVRRGRRGQSKSVTRGSNDAAADDSELSPPLSARAATGRGGIEEDDDDDEGGNDARGGNDSDATQNNLRNIAPTHAAQTSSEASQNTGGGATQAIGMLASPDASPQSAMDPVSTRSLLHSPRIAYDSQRGDSAILSMSSGQSPPPQPVAPPTILPPTAAAAGAVVPPATASRSPLGYFSTDFSRSSRGVVLERNITPFAAHPSSRPPSALSATATSITPVSSPAAPSAPSATPPAESNTPSGSEDDPRWYTTALESRREQLSRIMHQPETELEVGISRWHRTRHEHFSGPLLFANIPEYHCTDFDATAFEVENTTSTGLAAQVPYTCHAVANEVFPPEVTPVENLQPEDPYDLIMRPHAYLAAFRSSHYVAEELRLIEASDRAVVVEPENAADAVTCATVLVYLNPCRRWTLEQLETALRNFRWLDTDRPPRMDTKLIPELRRILLTAETPKVAELFFDAVERLPRETSLSATSSERSGSTPSTTYDDCAISPRHAKPVLQLNSLLAWMMSRTDIERRFLTQFHQSVLHCPSSADPSVFNAYVDSASCIGRENVQLPKPLTHVMAAFTRKAATADDLDRLLRGWLEALTHPETGVQRRNLVRYAADLEKQCPRAFVFQAVFTGDQLVRWILDHADRVGIVLCESRLAPRPGEREKTAVTFASNLISGGLLHAVSYTAAFNETVGIVTEPLRFRQSLERHGLYRFLCQEPRVCFASALPRNLSNHIFDHTNPDSVVITSFTVCRIALQWLYDSGSHSSTNPRTICEGLLQYLEDCNLTALTPTMRACFFVNLFNTLFCLVFSHLREADAQPRCVDYEIAMHTMTIKVAGMEFTLADIKHGILRGNALEPRMALRQFAHNDTRLRFAAVNRDPRWLLMLLDLADDHDIELLATPTFGAQGKTQQELSSSDEEEDITPEAKDDPLKSMKDVTTTGQDTSSAPSATGSRLTGTATSSRSIEASLQQPTDVNMPMVSNFATPSGGGAHQSWLVRRFFKRDAGEFEILRCAPLHVDDYEQRLNTTCRQVISLLTAAYQPASAAAGPSRPVSEAFKGYASKVMSTLKGCPELGSTRDAILNTLRGAVA